MKMEGHSPEQMSMTNALCFLPCEVGDQSARLQKISKPFTHHSVADSRGMRLIDKQSIRCGLAPGHICFQNGQHIQKGYAAILDKCRDPGLGRGREARVLHLPPEWKAGNCQRHLLLVTSSYKRTKLIQHSVPSERDAPRVG